eukprot:TRINITY_DN6937_c0_g1_i1.p1 TRINITY_DN6937_c0_g1~~TRINITY_DN6937_c0_g1_i1.p1  ORF type:complete len:501 (+),score=157.08 TRINITY_DN6937_c0_g1_i1:346-1848(+)
MDVIKELKKPIDRNPSNINVQKLIKTKIVCTLGPASNSEVMLRKMITEGMDVCRLNFSHGDHKDHIKTFELVRKLSKEFDHQVSILCDVQGPKNRVGRIEKKFTLVVGDKVNITGEKIIGNRDRFQIKYPNLIGDLKQDDSIFINDGIIRLRVLSKDTTDLQCVVEAGGDVSDHKGCNIPSGNLSVDIVTEKDREDLELIAKLDPEYVALSFVGSGKDIIQVRDLLREFGNSDIKICSKIERPVALDNIEEIVQQSDCVMVARGDLGVECDIWTIPKHQKTIIKLCNEYSKPVIVATQMLESMTNNVIPTRAEVTDVYQSVIDGTDCVMLSGESSVGKYPDGTVRMMDRIVSTAEQNLDNRNFEKLLGPPKNFVETMAHSVVNITKDLVLKNLRGKIISISDETYPARIVAKYRPQLDHIFFTSSLRAAREANFLWGVRSVYVEKIVEIDLESMISSVVKEGHNDRLLNIDEYIVVFCHSKRFSGATVGLYSVKSFLDDV